MLNYWFKILKSDENSLIRQIYSMLKHDSDTNITHTGCVNLGYQVKLILQKADLDFLWTTQANVVGNITYLTIKQRLLGVFYQS